jgi:hypothetical protein
MTNVQRFTGKNLNLQWIDATGTVAISGDQKSFEWDWTSDTEDMAAASDDYHYAYPTLMDIKASMEVLETGTSGTAVAARLAPQSSGTLLVSPLGTATGMPKWGFGLTVTKYTPKYPFEKAVMRSIEFQSRGGLVYNGNTVVW